MFIRLLHEAWISIGANRLRTFLAMLGIVIGVGSVVVMLAVGAGSQQSVERTINKLGTNLLIVTPDPKEYNGMRSYDISDLSAKDAELIAGLPSIAAAAPSTFPKEYQVSANKLNWKTRVVGTSPSFFLIRDWGLSGGDYFDDTDMTKANRVVVVGATVAKQLFPGEDPVGRNLRVENIVFRIAGVLEEKGQGLDGRDQDDVIVMPLSAARNKLWGANYSSGLVQVIYVKARSKALLEQAGDEITQALRERYKIRESDESNFSIRNLTAITRVASETTRALSLLLGAIASISLVVGGIGIMNIMLVTVAERTREIGIRKAIGASESHILIQFLLEAVIIALVGSLIGLVVGIGAGYAADRWFSIQTSYSLWSIVTALGIAITVGIASGIYPARKAARMQPIDALRMVGG